MICSESTLDSEISKLHEIFIKNGYPENIVKKTIDTKMKSFASSKMFGPHKSPVYIKLPYIGVRSEVFAKQISNIAGKCFFASNTRVIFKTRTIFPSFKKDVLPITNANSVIYKYNCSCDENYIGRTTQRLDVRMRQHVPLKLQNAILTRTSGLSAVESAIGQHLIENSECARGFGIDRFEILHKASTLFQLKVLEALSINIRKPSLCTQRDFSHTLDVCTYLV